ncbi:MAG TPA: hypothetical protein VL328_05370 [Gemmatimonadaceae bacterium]|jgi:hypothetical protein|nr:hypothetical protein [Gemmatimonadaceae bacterium]
MRRLAALLAVVFLTACANEMDQSTRPSSVVGTYELRAYGGRSLPALVSQDSVSTTEVLSGELVIAADQTWAETRVYRYTDAGGSQTVSLGSSGSWVFVRDDASMQFNDKVYDYQFTGTAAGGSVTLHLNDGNTVIYAQ